MKPEGKVEVLEIKEVAALDTTLPVAWLDLGGEKDVALPLVRLAEALDYDRQSLHDLINRNPVLKSYVIRVSLTDSENKVPSGRRSIASANTFILRPGAIGILIKLSTGHIKNPAKRERVEGFQHWALQELDQRLFGPPHPVPVTPPPYLLAVRCHACQSPLRPQIDAMLLGHSRKPDGSRYRYGDIVEWAARHGTRISRGGLSRHMRHLEEGLVSPRAMIPRYLRELAKRDPANIPTAQLARITELLTRQYELGLGNTA